MPSPARETSSPRSFDCKRGCLRNSENVVSRAGFEEYDAPVLERQELYKRKAGEEITQQMYSFVDKDGVEVTLRPEMTPTLARMVLSRGASMILPLKWFSIPQCWRFEATQRGRKREHYQWNMDIIGCKEITAEVELLSAAVEFLRAAGLRARTSGLKWIEESHAIDVDD